MALTIGVPRETFPGEKRVATVPDVVGKLIKLGFRVAVETGAGDAANFADDTYRAAGAEILPTAAEDAAINAGIAQDPDTMEITAADMALPPPAEGTAEAAARVAMAREAQLERVREAGLDPFEGLNARASGATLDRFAAPDEAGKALLMRAGEAGGLTARGWTRTLRLARTIADLEGAERVLRRHIAEALIYRRATFGAQGDFERRAAPTTPSSGLAAW